MDTKQIEKSAEQIIEYYKLFSKDGMVGAAEFMEAAASWNYDPNQRRPYQRNIINRGK